MPDEQIVSAREILEAAGAEKPVKGTFLQRTGLILAGCVGALISIVTLVLVGKWIFSAPAPPVMPAGVDATTARAILDNYKALQQIATDSYAAIFDMVVVKVLLPIFTSILGYIFGSRGGGKES